MRITTEIARTTSIKHSVIAMSFLKYKNNTKRQGDYGNSLEAFGSKRKRYHISTNKKGVI